MESNNQIPVLNFTDEDVSIISESHGFEGFLAPSQIYQAASAVTSMGLNLDLETQSSGNNQPHGVETQSSEQKGGTVVLPDFSGWSANDPAEPTKTGEVGAEALCSPELVGEPMARSTPLGKLVDPSESPADSTKTEEAGLEDGFQLDKAGRKRRKKVEQKKRKQLILDMEGLSVNGGDSQGSGTLGSRRAEEVKSKPAKVPGKPGTLAGNPGRSDPAPKRGRNSSGHSKSGHSEPTSKRTRGASDTNGERGRSSVAPGPHRAQASEPKTGGGTADAAKHSAGSSSANSKLESGERSQEEPPPSRPTFAEAVGRNICLMVIPLDTNDNQVGAVADDRIFMEMIENNIIKAPNVRIKNIRRKGLGLEIECLGPGSVDFVKGVISPLKGPRSVKNRKGYLCLGPGDRPPLKIYGVWVERPILPKKSFVELLKHANEWLKPHPLHIIRVCRKEVGGETKGATFLVGVEPELKAELEKRNFKLHYGAGRTAQFKEKPKPKGK